MGKTTERFQCVGHCKKEFGVMDWECVPGLKHEVEPRTFYMLDAPVLSEKDVRGKAFRDSRTFVNNVPPEKTMTENGMLVKIPARSVLFARGMYTTSDPEEIFWLEKHGHGETTKERWKEVYFSPLEKQELREIETRNRERESKRVLQEANDLLASVKSQKTAQKTA